MEEGVVSAEGAPLGAMVCWRLWSRLGFNTRAHGTAVAGEWRRARDKMPLKRSVYRIYLIPNSTHKKWRCEKKTPEYESFY